MNDAGLFWIVLGIVVLILFVLWFFKGHNVSLFRQSRAVYPVAELMPHMQSGDVLLFSNSNFPGMKLLFGAEWTHVALVLREPVTNILYLYESLPEHLDNKGMTDLITNQYEKSGPQLNRLEDRVNFYTGYMAWRPLMNVSLEQRQSYWSAMFSFMNEMSQYRFEYGTKSTLWLQLAKYFKKRNNHNWFVDSTHWQKRHGVFCSELIAASLAHLGILDDSVQHCSSFAPAQFAQNTLPFRRENSDLMYSPKVFELQK